MKRFLALTAAAFLAAGGWAQAIPGIFDTDMGNDVDDALALAMLHALESRGECRLLGVTVTKDNPWAAVYVDLVNTFYGRGRIPVGMVNGGVTPEGSPMIQTPAERRRADGTLVYPRRLASGAEAPEAVGLLRRVLAAGGGGRAVRALTGGDCGERLRDRRRHEVSGGADREGFRMGAGSSGGGCISRLHEDAVRPADVGVDGAPVRGASGRGVLRAVGAGADYHGRRRPYQLSRGGGGEASISGAAGVTAGADAGVHGGVGEPAEEVGRRAPFAGSPALLPAPLTPRHSQCQPGTRRKRAAGICRTELGTQLPGAEEAESELRSDAQGGALCHHAPLLHLHGNGEFQD